MGEIPFVFGRIAGTENYTDREAEAVRLRGNFEALTNTIIISPRRWGKSSLVQHVASGFNDEHCSGRNKDSNGRTGNQGGKRTGADKIKVCLIDMFNVKSEPEFYAHLAQALVKATSDKWEEWLKTARDYLGNLRPVVTLGGTGLEELSFDIEWQKVAKTPDDIIDLAESIAKSKGVKLVVCIDEFQSIGGFEDSLGFQRKLRAHWQQHQNVCYCLYGSKRHMLLDIFENPQMPFYRFGDLMLLEKIGNAVWADFIHSRFASTGKAVTLEQAASIAARADNHSYYVQQLAQQVWLRTEKTCTEQVIDDAMNDLKDQLGLLFANLMDSLTAKQVGLLRAVLNGETELSSTTVLRNYNLGTSGNVKRLKEALLAKEIIDVSGRKIELLDPMFKYWLQKDYFG
jgi:hypothetical protein